MHVGDLLHNICFYFALLSGPNEIPTFRQTMDEYFAKASDLGIRIVEFLALALECERVRSTSITLLLCERLFTTTRLAVV